jgi:hypothetical protein
MAIVNGAVGLAGTGTFGGTASDVFFPARVPESAAQQPVAVAPVPGPCTNAVAVTTSDTAYLPAVTRKVYVGTGGALAVLMRGGGVVTISNVPSGTTLDIQVKRVMATNTTATSIIAFW